nr:immunoglobulin heavy chain junction region [Mus musculus]
CARHYYGSSPFDYW